MTLSINTFRAGVGGLTFFKAVGHPLTASAHAALVAKLRAAPRPVVAYDPAGYLSEYAALHGLRGEDIDLVLVQNALRIGGETLGHKTRAVSELPQSGVKTLFVVAHDAVRRLAQIAPWVPDGCNTLSLDDARLPEHFLVNQHDYLFNLNFATNFAFFRDEGGRHTRVVTANYWGAYGAKDPFLWCRLFDADGKTLADFEHPLGKPGAVVVLDSRDIRTQHKLPEFCGQLFLSVINGAGHDIVKYVIDTFGDNGDDTELSCTHDSNAWPSDLYAGLPAPKNDERVVLWVQNSHPTPIPAGNIGLNVMGHVETRTLDEEILPFATYPLDVAELFPEVKWPRQFEIQAGKWFSRPRYEVLHKSGRRRINHPNVERVDLEHDEEIRRIAPLMGKSFILPAPIMPQARYRSECLPTPMATIQDNLPVVVTGYDATGTMIWQKPLGLLPRNHDMMLDLSVMGTLSSDYGHAELTYDFTLENGVLDGWLHSLFRYTDLESGHAADTSFGSHIFNHAVIFRGEPQSYKGPPPGLSTRLFLRLLLPPAEVFCHLIYPVSHKWHPQSDTVLALKNADGDDIAIRKIQIPAGGSFRFECGKMFAKGELRASFIGDRPGYVIVRDTTCRLFGYHGARHGNGFALDHMFGF